MSYFGILNVLFVLTMIFKKKKSFCQKHFFIKLSLFFFFLNVWDQIISCCLYTVLNYKGHNYQALGVHQGGQCGPSLIMVRRSVITGRTPVILSTTSYSTLRGFHVWHALLLTPKLTNYINLRNY